MSEVKYDQPITFNLKGVTGGRWSSNGEGWKYTKPRVFLPGQPIPAGVEVRLAKESLAHMAAFGKCENPVLIRTQESRPRSPSRTENCMLCSTV